MDEHGHDQKAAYEIRVSGMLDKSWSDWFDGFSITTLKNQTLLKGEVSDQAALLGILMKISQLNLVLLSLKRIDN